MSRSSSGLLMKADEKQAEASKNGYGVSRNRASDFNRLQDHLGITPSDSLGLPHMKRLNHITRWFILGILEQLTRQKRLAR